MHLVFYALQLWSSSTMRQELTHVSDKHKTMQVPELVPELRRRLMGLAMTAQPNGPDQRPGRTHGSPTENNMNRLSFIVASLVINHYHTKVGQSIRTKTLTLLARTVFGCFCVDFRHDPLIYIIVLFF